MGEITRADGAKFSSEQLESVLTTLQHYLSFCLGRWAGVSMPVGFDVDGNRVYERWGITLADGERQMVVALGLTP